MATVFAGADIEATARAREAFPPYPPSSPSVALLRDGKLVYMLERRDIETRDARSIAAMLTQAFDEHCQTTDRVAEVRLDAGPTLEVVAAGLDRPRLRVYPPRVCISRCGSRRSAIDGNERRAIARGQTLLGAAIAAHFPRRANQLRELIGGGAGAQRPAQVGAVRGVQAQVPQAVGRQPAAIAALAERLRRRRDDAEDRAVRQAVAIGRRRRLFDDRRDRAVVRRRAAASISRRDTTRAIDQCVAPPTSMYSMNRTSAPCRPAELDQIDQLVVVDAADDDGVELEAGEERRGGGDAVEHAIELVVAREVAEAIAAAACRG